MTYKFALKAGCAALALAAGGFAHAGLFYMNVGSDYAVGDSGQVNSTSTSMKNQLTFQYQSTTVFTDQDNSFGISGGDTTLTTAGLAIPGAGVAENNVTGFTPNQVFGGANSNNGYGVNWQMSFGITNLTGAVTSFGTGPEITYNAGGLISLYLWDQTSGAAQFNFMNIKVTGGSSGTGGTVIDGVVDFTGIAGNPFANLFHSGSYSCGGGTGFYDLWSTCGANPPGDLKIQFRGDFNTDPNGATAIPVGVDSQGHALIQYGPVKHDGSATFNIPEPGSLALLGLGLAGLGVAQRRRKLAK